MKSYIINTFGDYKIVIEGKKRTQKIARKVLDKQIDIFMDRRGINLRDKYSNDEYSRLYVKTLKAIKKYRLELCKGTFDINDKTVSFIGNGHSWSNIPVENVYFFN